MKNLLLSLLLLLPLGLFAQDLKEGSPLKTMAIKDQFEKNIAITTQTKQILLAFSKEQGEKVKVFLEANPNYLAENNAIYLMDVSTVPGMVMSMFMLPKFQKYSYTVGLVENEKDIAYFPKKENLITVITLDNLNVTSIAFKEVL
ncbi:MAG: hypothetical protein KA253_02795 [Campylobacteraceae bacterium]|jgi:hypothetical protein|nr:hypothetical protein [Campylobacteraceae bacterium]